MEQLVSDMLSFARGDQYVDAAFSWTTCWLPLGTSVAPVLGDRAVADYRVGVTRLLTMTGNREALAGALINLVRNALQAAGDKARVVVSTDITAADVHQRQ